MARYHLRLFIIIAAILVCCRSQPSGKCPTVCQCYLDPKGRHTVECKHGGMKGSLQFSNMSMGIEVLKISAPDDNMNDLSMNPGIRQFRQLEEIHITKSNIPNLGEKFFYGLSKLEVLNLAQNNITQPLPTNFLGLIRLQQLSLDDNRIDSLPSETFRHLTDLRMLSVQQNRIQQIAPGVFRGLIKLRVLKLSWNYIRHFEAEVFKDLRDLRRLECRGCQLKAINRHVVELLPLLSHLDLSENEIKVLDTGDFSNTTNLRVLRLDANQIRDLPGYVLGTHAGLTNLSLARNQIANIANDAFANLVNLTALDLGYNNLKHLTSDALTDTLGSLERLVLSGNRIALIELKRALHDATLKDLQLADCSIAEINAIFIPDTVTTLNLANNQLSYLSVTVLPPSLRDLDISGNLFRGLEQEVVEKDIHFKLDHNPWSCDLCHIIPMLERVNRSEDLYKVRCALPYHHTKKVLGTILREDLSWCNADGYSSEGINFFLSRDDGRLGIFAAAASLLLLVITTFAVLAALCYSRRHAANYYTHEDKRDEKESIFENLNPSPIFGGEELSFKFPLEVNDMKISIATIDEIRKEHDSNSTTTTLTGT